MSHQPFHAPGTIRVECLYSLYYFEFACGYVFAGEQHDFWEMVYIDRGEAEIGATVDAISSATVTSKAIARSVNSAVAVVTGADAASAATSWGG